MSSTVGCTENPKRDEFGSSFFGPKLPLLNLDDMYLALVYLLGFSSTIEGYILFPSDSVINTPYFAEILSLINVYLVIIGFSIYSTRKSFF